MQRNEEKEGAHSWEKEDNDFTRTRPTETQKNPEKCKVKCTKSRNTHLNKQHWLWLICPINEHLRDLSSLVCIRWHSKRNSFGFIIFVFFHPSIHLFFYILFLAHHCWIGISLYGTQTECMRIGVTCFSTWCYSLPQKSFSSYSFLHASSRSFSPPPPLNWFSCWTINTHNNAHVNVTFPTLVFRSLHSLTVDADVFVRVSLSFTLSSIDVWCNGIVCALKCMWIVSPDSGVLACQFRKKSNASHVFTRHLKN